MTVAPGWTRYESINHIRDLAFAADGTLWAATMGGLVHWDLRTGTYTRYPVQAAEIAAAPDGTLWLILAHGVCHFDGAGCQVYTTADGLGSNTAHSVAIAPNGLVWLGTDRGVSRFDGMSWKSYPSNVPTLDLAIAANGEVWAATPGGVGRYYPGQDLWTTYGEGSWLPSLYTTRIATGPEGEVWTYVLWEGVYRLDESAEGTSWEKVDEPCGGLISDVAFAGDGIPWVASSGSLHYPGGCLAYRQGDAWTEIARERGLVSINVVALGPGGEVAANTSLGLGLYDGDGWHLLRDGPTQNRATTVAVTPDGAAWFGFGDHSVSTTGGGLSRFDGREWQAHLDDAEVNVLAVAPDGSLWAGVGCEVQRFDGADWETVGRCDQDLPRGNIFDIDFTQDGATWVANGFALARFDGRSWTIYDRLANSVLATPGGAVWIEGWEGRQGSQYVAGFDGQTWTTHQAVDALPGSVKPRVATPDGRVWGVVSPGRLGAFDGRSWTEESSWTFYDLPHELAGESIYRLSVAPDGALWITTDKGVARFDSGSEPDTAWTTYAWHPGLAAGDQGPMAFAPDGTIWFGTMRFQPAQALQGATRTLTPELSQTRATPTRAQPPTPTPVTLPRFSPSPGAPQTGPTPAMPTAGARPTETPMPAPTPRVTQATVKASPTPLAAATELVSPSTPSSVLPSLQVLAPDNVTALAPITHLGKGGVNGLAWSPQGESLALATSQGIDLYSATAGLLVGSLPTEARALSLAFSPDGRLLAATLADKTVRIWEVEGGRLRHSLWGHAQPVGHVAFAPDGRWLISGGGDETLRLWDVETGQQLRALSVPTHSRFLLSADGRWIAAGGGKWNRRVLVWEAATGRLAHQVEILPDLTGLAFGPDGRMLAILESGRHPASVLLLDLDSGQTRQLQHVDSIRCLGFSPDSAFLATGDSGGSVCLWDLSTGRAVRTLRAHAEGPYELTFALDGSWLASADVHEIKVWDLAAGTARYTLPAHASRRLASSPDSSYLAWQQGSSPRLLDLAAGGALTLLGHAGTVASLAFSPDGRLLAVGDWDGMIQLWDLVTGQAVRKLAGHSGPVGALTFSPDGRSLASGGMNEDQTIRLWNVVTGEIIRRLPGDPNYPAGRLVFSPDGARLAGGGRQGVILWDLATDQTLRLEGHSEGVLSLAISPDGQRLASGSFDTTVVVWDLASGQVLYRLPGHTLGAAGLAFSPNGAHLVTGDQGGVIRIWDAASGELRQTIEGRGAELAFSPDGALLAFKATLNDIVLWDTVAARAVHRVEGAWPIALSPDGRLLASGTPDGIVILWGVEN